MRKAVRAIGLAVAYAGAFAAMVAVCSALWAAEAWKAARKRMGR